MKGLFMKLHLSKKTYYAMGSLAGALTLVQAVLAFANTSFALLDNIGFGFTGLMILFLASVKGTPMGDKRSLFGIFLVLIGSVFFNIPLLQYILMGLVWPLFANYEKNRDAAMTNPFRAVCLTDILCIGLRIFVNLGNVTGLGLPLNLAGLASGAAHLWLTMCLYKREN